MSVDRSPPSIVVRGTEILPTDPPRVRLQKIARVTLDSMVQFVGLLDAHGTVIEINKVALDAVGIKLSDVEGQPFWTTFWWQVSPEINQLLRDSIARAAQGEFVRWDTEIYGRAGGKVTIVIDASLMPVKDDDGNVVYICAEGRDITEKKAQERELAQKNIELQALLERVRELDKIKTQFFSNVSHEFRTPLTLMLGPLDQLLETNPDQLSAATRDQLEVVNRNGLRLLRLVNTLLDFSRIEAGRAKATYRATDLASLTCDLASVFRSAVERAGLKLIVDCSPLSEPAYVDRDMWEKVILNLLSNAFKFTFAGEITVTMRQIGRDVVTSIQDTGTGIPTAEIPKLFERFYRVENAQGRTHEGSGIGLALVQELVKLQGGSISVDSQLGEGSVFQIRMPLGKAHISKDQIDEADHTATTSTRASAYVEEALRWLPETEGAASASDSSSRLNTTATPVVCADVPPKVLIADDNADMRQYLARILAPHYRIETAADGRAALTAAKNDPPDLIVTDVMMPQMDGFQFLAAVRGDETLKATPTILLSARAGEESRIEGLQAGADDYLVKPFAAKELLARVAAHLHATKLRQEATEALRTSEERYRALTKAGSDVVYRMSPDWSEMRHLVGREFIADIHEPSKTWVEKYIHPQDRPEVVEAIREAIRTKGVFELEHRVLRVDGTMGWILSRAIPILDSQGNIVEWFGAATDVNARRQAEAALKQQRRVYEAILTNTPDFAYVIDIDHRFMYANENLLKMWGRSWNDTIGKRFAELGYEPWHAVMHDREIDQVIATRQPIRGEVPFHGSFGRRIYDYIFVPVFGPNGEVEAIAGTTREADRRKDEFLATLAHELRNPLAPIRNSIQILSLSAPGDSTTERVCEMMERQVNHMVRLVDDLMEVSRITRGAFELRKEQTTLAAIVRSAIDTNTPAIEAAGHQLSVTLPDEAVPIIGDPVRLSQVISNLLSNAARYTDPGGRIWLNAETTADAIIIRIRDNGIGIPAEALPLVFEMFMQVERSTERSQGGLGIGLTLVKRLVEMHGGKVSVRSDGPGQGSEFTVSLPKSVQPTEPFGSSPTQLGQAAFKHRVLVVDDNEDAATSLGMLVKIHGADVQVAHDGPTALALMEARGSDLVFLDLGMPGMDGFEVARRARLIPGYENVVLVALTGWGQEDDRKRTRAAGFDHHLVKPVGITELQAMFATVER
jgi:PAS domain S-box-containing protein